MRCGDGDAPLLYTQNQDSAARLRGSAYNQLQKDPILYTLLQLRNGPFSSIFPIRPCALLKATPECLLNDVRLK